MLAAGATWAALAFVVAGQPTGRCTTKADLSEGGSDVTYAARAQSEQPDEAKEDVCYVTFGKEKESCLAAKDRGCAWGEETGTCYKPMNEADQEHKDDGDKKDMCYSRIGKDKETCLAASGRGCVWHDRRGTCYKPAEDGDQESKDNGDHEDTCHSRIGKDKETCLAASDRGCVWHDKRGTCYKPKDDGDQEYQPDKHAAWCEGIGRDRDKCLADGAQMRGCAWGEETGTCFHQDRCWAVFGSDQERCKEATTLGLGCAVIDNRPSKPCYSSSREKMDGCFARFGNNERLCDTNGEDACTWHEELGVCHLVEKVSERAQAPPQDDWCYLQAGTDKEQCDALSTANELVPGATNCMFVEDAAPAPPIEEARAAIISSCGAMYALAVGIAALS
jgi:hypothetical protein